MTQTDQFAIDAAELDQLIAEKGRDPSACIPLLQAVQARYRYLPQPALDYIVHHTEITPAQVYGIATFYTAFRLRPIGRHLIRVCHGTACHVGGAESISKAVRDALGVEEGGTTEDGRFTLEQVACLGCCALAPVVTVDDDYHGKVKPREVKRILAKYD
jgi:NADH:ubiquinone oxidoreductase subunit E